MKIIYKVTFDDSVDGRGPSKTLGYFNDEQTAKLAAEGRGSWNSDGNISKSYLYESLEDLNEVLSEETKRRALAKLSIAEKKALGLI